MTAPQPTGDDSVRVARQCWDELQLERKRRNVSLRKLAEELRREFPREGPASSTLQDWLKDRQSLPDKPLFLGLVRLLGLDESHWTGRWEQWDRARIDQPYVRNHAKTLQSDNELVDAPSPPAAGDVSSSLMTEPSPDLPLLRRTRRRRAACWGLVAGGVIAGASVIAAAVVAGLAPPVGDTAAQVAEPRCAAVVTDRAEVFRNPGVDVLTVKQRGEKITLPSEAEDVVGGDDRRYQVVRTPTRTASGHAYMLAETLAPTAC